MDGNGRDSPYTEALSKAMRDMHEPVEQVFKHVRVGVMGATANKQVPWESSSLTGDFYFASENKTASITTPALASVPIPAATSPVRTAPVEDGMLSRISNWFGSSKPEPTVSIGHPAPGPNLVVATAPIGSVPGERALPMLKLLGIQSSDIDHAKNYPQATIRQMVERSTRHVTIGNSQREIQAALAMCRKYHAKVCELDMFSDEVLRTADMQPFDLDTVPVSVAAFRQFVDATRYVTDAEKAGFAYNFGDRDSIPGGNWRNGVKHDMVDEAAVVGVSLHDAQAYCRYKNQRLPTEDEWEYAARGPERHTFPWGENMGPAVGIANAAPRVGDGPAEGIDGRFRGMSGNVWQWVDTRANTPQGQRVLLKGGSWVDSNPVFRRAATRRYDVPDRADEDTGFRCARTVSAWPDADSQMAQLR
jgi:formylglycine-generating enzyme